MESVLTAYSKVAERRQFLFVPIHKPCFSRSPT